MAREYLPLQKTHIEAVPFPGGAIGTQDSEIKELANGLLRDADHCTEIGLRYRLVPIDFSFSGDALFFHFYYHENSRAFVTSCWLRVVGIRSRAGLPESPDFSFFESTGAGRRQKAKEHRPAFCPALRQTIPVAKERSSPRWYGKGTDGSETPGRKLKNFSFRSSCACVLQFGLDLCEPRFCRVDIEPFT
jgi:hypothetical protein